MLLKEDDIDDQRRLTEGGEGRRREERVRGVGAGEGDERGERWTRRGKKKVKHCAGLRNKALTAAIRSHCLNGGLRMLMM